jgi:hypothetical protein
MSACNDCDLDEVRRAWIVAHQGVSTIQRRRGELLGRRLRTRQRALANAVPDPHDDTTIPPLWFRGAKSAASQLELIAVASFAVVAPVGWLGGWLLKRTVTLLIPNTLRAFPIAALLWSGVALGLVLVLLYQPTPSVWQIVVTPWLCLQVAAIPAVAGMYGVLEGWLAVRVPPVVATIPPKRPIAAAEAPRFSAAATSTERIGSIRRTTACTSAASPTRAVGHRT